MSFMHFLPHALSALYVLGKNSMTNGSVAAGFVAAGSGKAQRAAETKWRMLSTNPRVKVMAIVEGSDLDVCGDGLNWRNRRCCRVCFSVSRWSLARRRCRSIRSATAISRPIAT